MEGTTSPQTAASRPITLDFRIAAAGIGLLVIGAFGPWAKIGEFSVSGTDGGKDGTITLILALIAGAILAYTTLKGIVGRKWTIGLAVCAGLCLLICIIDISDIGSTDVGVPGLEASVGWGLWLSLLGSLALAGAVAMRLKNKS